MKKSKINFPIIFISVMLAFLFATGIASWIISISSSFTLAEYSQEGELLSSIDTTSPTYDGNVHLPTLVENPTINFKDEIVFESYDFHFRKKGDLAWTEITFSSPYEPFVYQNNAPMNAGDYEIKYTDATGYEYIVDYKIKQATPVVTVTPTLSAVIYGELPTITQPTGNVASYTLFDNSVEEFGGTFEYVDEEDARFNSGARNYSGSDTSTNVSTSLKFIPSNNNYERIIVDGKYTVDAVAYLNGDTPTYYCTIEKALESNTSSGTIYVIPEKNPSIFESCVVANGVTLSLPYSGTNIGGHDQDQMSGTGTESYARNNPSEYKKSEVTLNEGLILTVNGTLTIGGILTGGQLTAGHTCNNYAQITMKASSQIICNKTLNCYGYIIGEYGEGETSVTIKNGGTLKMPFIVQEHRGGTIFRAMAHLEGLLDFEPKLKTSPFNRFHFNNIESLVIYEYGGVLIGMADLYASRMHNETQVKMIGPYDSSGTNKYLLSSYEGTVIKSRYVHSTQINKIDVYGGLSLLPLEIIVSGITISTAKILMPISWYYNLTFNKYESGDDSSIDFTQQSIRLLPGAKLTINDGVTVNGNVLSIFESIPQYLSGDSGLKYPKVYPTGDIQGQTIPGAYFELNGTLIINELGGIVNTKKEEANLTIKTSTVVQTQELIDYVDPDPKYETKREYLRVYLYTSSGVSNVLNVIGAGEYESKMDSKGKCGWLTNEINISYDLNLGEGIIEYKNGLSIRDDNGNVIGYPIKESDYPSIDNPQRDYYTFKGWSLDPNDDPDNITSSIGEVVYANTVFYAIWKPIKYTITYDTNNFYNGKEYKEDDSLQISNETIQNDYPTNYNVEGRYPLPEPVLEGYKFGGWYTDYSEESGYTNKITEIDGALYSGNKTIYGVWNPDYVKEYSISFEIMYNDELLAKAINSDLGFGDTTQNSFEETGVDFDLTNYINRLIAYNENSTIDLYYSVIYLVMPNGTETKINIDNSVVKITDNNTLNNTITFKIYQYDKIKVVFDQNESLETNVIPNNTTVDTYSKYITFVVPNPSNVTQGYRMVWFTSEDLNNATFFIGGEEYSDGINSSISNFDADNNQLTLYGEQYYLFNSSDLDSNISFYTNILFYQFDFNNFITSATVSVGAGGELTSPKDNSIQSSSFKGKSIEKIIIYDCYDSDVSTTLGVTGKHGVKWDQWVVGWPPSYQTKYFSVRKYCGLFDSVSGLKQVIFGDEEAVSLVGKYAFSDVDTSSIDFIGINTTTITNGYDTQSTSSTTPPTDERTINIIKRL